MKLSVLYRAEPLASSWLVRMWSKNCLAAHISPSKLSVYSLEPPFCTAEARKHQWLADSIDDLTAEGMHNRTKFVWLCLYTTQNLYCPSALLSLGRLISSVPCSSAFPHSSPLLEFYTQTDGDTTPLSVPQIFLVYTTNR
jgi:hypothetical protein